MSVSDAIEAVKNISSDLAVLPESEEYDAIIKSYFSELERELKPACFLTPNSASQVAEIVKAIKPFASHSNIAICGSGQQATPAVANVRDGLTIHLRNLRGVEIDVEKNVVSVAAGEQMGKVYETVMAAGLGAVGNRHSSGGIGGDAVQGESRYVMNRSHFDAFQVDYRTSLMLGVSFATTLLTTRLSLPAERS